MDRLGELSAVFVGWTLSFKVYYVRLKGDRGWWPVNTLLVQIVLAQRVVFLMDKVYEIYWKTFTYHIPSLVELVDMLKEYFSVLKNNPIDIYIFFYDKWNDKHLYPFKVKKLYYYICIIFFYIVCKNLIFIPCIFCYAISVSLEMYNVVVQNTFLFIWYQSYASTLIKTFVFWACSIIVSLWIEGMFLAGEQMEEHFNWYEVSIS